VDAGGYQPKIARFATERAVASTALERVGLPQRSVAETARAGHRMPLRGHTQRERANRLNRDRSTIVSHHHLHTGDGIPPHSPRGNAEHDQRRTAKYRPARPYPVSEESGHTHRRGWPASNSAPGHVRSECRPHALHRDVQQRRCPKALEREDRRRFERHRPPRSVLDPPDRVRHRTRRDAVQARDGAGVLGSGQMRRAARRDRDRTGKDKTTDAEPALDHIPARTITGRRPEAPD